jgi:hypothetical protein
MLPEFPFTDRDKELEKLLHIWGEVCAPGTGPRMVTLLGEPGYGKTRLIREFYCQIANKDQKRGTYWPDDLPNDVTRMDINPLFSEVSPSAEIPWIWWAIRCEPSQTRNAIQDEGCAFIRSSEHLLQHTGALEKKRADTEKIERLKAAGITQALKFAEEIPIVGTIIRQYSSGKDWLELYRSTIDATKKSDLLSPVQKSRLDIQNASEACIKICQAFIDPTDKNLPTVPMVLVVDDAHAADPLTIQSVYRIFHYAHVRNLPLLVVASYWAKNWGLGESDIPSNLTITESWKSFRQIVSALPRKPGETESVFHEIECEEVDCAPILRSLNFNLGEKAERHCLEFADSNPQMLRELLSFLIECRQHRSKDWWFKNPAPELQLSDNGFEEFRQASRSREEFLKRRAEELHQDPNLSTLLQLGALQGHNFLGRFTAEVWKDLDNLHTNPIPAHMDLLHSAEAPHHVIRLSGTGQEFARFRHRSYREAFLSIDPEQKKGFLDAITTKTAAWLETLAPDISNAEFFHFAVNWFRENGSAGELIKALAIRAGQLSEIGQPARASELLGERLRLIEEMNGAESPEANIANFEYAKALAECWRFEEAIKIFARLRSVFQREQELWVDCSRCLARTLQNKSEAEGYPKQSFGTAVSFTPTSTADREKAAQILLEVWLKLRESHEPKSLEVLLAGLDFGNAISEGASDRIIRADQRLFIYPCAATLLYEFGEKNDWIKDLVLSALGNYNWGWKIETPKGSRLRDAELFYEECKPLIKKLKDLYPHRRNVFQALREHRTQKFGKRHPATFEARRLEVESQRITDFNSFEEYISGFDELINDLKIYLGIDHPETLKCQKALAGWLEVEKSTQSKALVLWNEIHKNSILGLGINHPWTIQIQRKIQSLGAILNPT